MSDSDALGIGPNYSKTIRDVFLDVTKIIRRHSPSNLRYLTGNGIGCGEEDYNLPSWVRNYAWQPTDPRLTWCERQRQSLYELYNVSKNLTTGTEIVSDTQLSLQATMIGQIRSVGQPHADKPFLETFSVVKSWAHSIGIDLLTAAEAGIDLQAKSFWRTLMADAKFDAIYGWSRLTEEELSEYMREIVKVQQAETNGEQQYLRDSIMKIMVVATYGRSFCVTDGGEIGMCPLATVAGDQAWILAGGNTVFILRKTVDTNGYLLVGDAYLHGFMNGEAALKEWQLN
jgi:hypothetical protein